MDDATLTERRRASQMAFYRALGNAGRGAHWRAVRDGVQATVVPVTPERSLPNSVLYTDAGAVLDAHEELAALYAAAGVRAWTVWAMPGDEDLVAGLEARGHTLDGTPAIMAAAMEEIDLSEGGEPLDLDPAPAWELLGTLNDRAYGLPEATFAPALAGVDDPALRAFVARLDGVPVAGAATLDGPDGDCALEFVATLPEARGRGLASQLVRHALRAARARGRDSVTLEGSSMGTPVYTRLGYRTLGRMRMYELRRDA